MDTVIRRKTEIVKKSRLQAANPMIPNSPLPTVSPLATNQEDVESNTSDNYLAQVSGRKQYKNTYEETKAQPVLRRRHTDKPPFKKPRQQQIAQDEEPVRVQVTNTQALLDKVSARLMTPSFGRSLSQTERTNRTNETFTAEVNNKSKATTPRRATHQNQSKR